MKRKKFVVTDSAKTQTDEYTKQDEGQLVCYYAEGYRYGYIDSVNQKKRTMKIRPIGPIGTKPHCITARFDDVKIERKD